MKNFSLSRRNRVFFGKSRPRSWIRKFLLILNISFSFVEKNLGIYFGLFPQILLFYLLFLFKYLSCLLFFFFFFLRETFLIELYPFRIAENFKSTFSFPFLEKDAGISHLFSSFRIQFQILLLSLLYTLYNSIFQFCIVKVVSSDLLLFLSSIPSYNRA